MSVDKYGQIVPDTDAEESKGIKNMKIEIGKNIRSLRQAKQITQEQLADYLGMTPQAVSRWENGSGYPDLESIPALASFFCITSDELLGIDNSSRRQRLTEIEDEISRLSDISADCSDCKKALDFARLAVAEFPSEPALQMNLADCICKTYMWEENPDMTKLNEAERIYLTLLRQCEDSELRFQTVFRLCSLYANGFHNPDKAEETAGLLPPMLCCSERAKAYNLSGEKTAENIQKYIELLTDELASAILTFAFRNSDIPNDASTWDSKIEMLQTAVKLLHLIFGEDLKFYCGMAADAYRAIATYELAQEKYDDALDTLDKVCDYTIAFDNAKAGESYCSPIVSHIVSAPEDDAAHNLSFITLNSKFTQERYNPIRLNNRFICITERLKETAR